MLKSLCPVWHICLPYTATDSTRGRDTSKDKLPQGSGQRGRHRFSLPENGPLTPTFSIWNGHGRAGEGQDTPLPVHPGFRVLNGGFLSLWWSRWSVLTCVPGGVGAGASPLGQSPARLDTSSIFINRSVASVANSRSCSFVTSTS